MDHIHSAELSLNPAIFSPGDDHSSGNGTLSALLELASQAIARLQANTQQGGAAVARLRGNGPGVSFRQTVSRLEAEHPIELIYPFEGNDRVGGAAWPSVLGDTGDQNVVMKLRWERQANDLPMHTHQHSDRCIIVLEGRGFFHVTGEPHPSFSGPGVQTIAARERDVFIFTRGVVHTFSTFDDPMVLLSCHLPYIPLNDPRQYTLPAIRWTACEHLDSTVSHKIILDGWSILPHRRDPDTQ